MLAASASLAQQPVLDDGKQASLKDCDSVVIVKCDRSSATNPRVAEEARQESRRANLRRQDALVQTLDGVVIEDNAIRRRSVEDVMAGAFPTVRPRGGDYTFATSESSKCTCMNVCPPWPLPCCTCSRQMGRYSAMPGSSPLN